MILGSMLVIMLVIIGVGMIKVLVVLFIILGVLLKDS